MKKLLTLLSCFLLVFGLSACAGSQSSVNTNDNYNGTSSDQSKEDSSVSNTNSTETSGKTLVVYYSASGNTEKVANYIKDALGADIFEIEPA